MSIFISEYLDICHLRIFWTMAYIKLLFIISSYPPKFLYIYNLIQDLKVKIFFQICKSSALIEMLILIYFGNDWQNNTRMKQRVAN